ncbi:MAG: RdgB/HAM1 family non-canonical purine NTP pyrophosphatase [Acidobacteriia bacterium]|nr:RdgB/HAM1 family non-canonical purine NTP pyrophosphatase [Terriglobia bacterium]
MFLASSNAGKLAEYRVLAENFSSSISIELALLPGFDGLPAYEETAPTFAENALGKALHYSRLREGLVFADDSGLAVPALGGAPGVRSARYAGLEASSEECNRKLLGELSGKNGPQRAAYFVCAIALAEQGCARAIVTARVDGEILESPRGSGRFGYDPLFFFPPLGKAFAELSREEKNEHSHRGKAFRRLLSLFTA